VHGAHILNEYDVVAGTASLANRDVRELLDCLLFGNVEEKQLFTFLLNQGSLTT